MKSINLYSIYKISEHMDIEICNKTLSNLHKVSFLNMREQEYKGLDKLIKSILLINDDFKMFDNFFVGFKIDRISKEFDLLKISDETVLNIEIKSSGSVEKLKKQLYQNKKYLNSLNREIHLFSYNSGEDILYYLEGDNLLKVGFNKLVNIMGRIENNEIDIMNVFRPTNFLVSPLNKPQEFLENKYFLTDEQYNIVKSIKKSLKNNETKYFKIEGQPGTGKTLLIFDLAFNVFQNKKVCLVHCGKLSAGHNVLRQKTNLDIFSIKNIRKRDLSKYDVIFFDESQRIFEGDWKHLKKEISKLNKIVVFSLDPEQILSKKEAESGTLEDISILPNIVSFKLNTSVRTNPDIMNFIRAFMDKSKKNKIKNTISIDVFPSKNQKQSKNIIEILKEKDYEFIKYTPSFYFFGHMDDMPNGKTSHEVLGQEFESVVVVLNDDFFYAYKRLMATAHPNPNYLYEKLFYQAATRAKEKLAIIVENNTVLLKELLDLFE